MDLGFPLLSIIVPIFNRGNMIIDLLNSIYRIEHMLIEVIIVDDGSTDDTPELIDKWRLRHIEPNITVRLFRRKNKGACAARNFGMNVAVGEFIFFMDSDDLVVVQGLELALERLESDPSLDFVFGDRDILQEDLNVLKDTRFFARLDLELSASNVVLNGFWTSLPVFRSRFVKQLKWNEDLASQQDWEFMARVAHVARHVEYVNISIAVLRVHHGERISRGAAGIREGLRSRARACISLAAIVKSEDCQKACQRYLAQVFLLRSILGCCFRAIANNDWTLVRDIIWVLRRCKHFGPTLLVRAFSQSLFKKLGKLVTSCPEKS